MTNLIDSLPLAALVTVHNSLTKNTVKKFENRTKARRRIEDLLKGRASLDALTFEQAAANAGVKPAPSVQLTEADKQAIRRSAERILGTTTPSVAAAAPRENPDDTDPAHEDKTDTTDDETGHGDKVEDDTRTATGPDIMVRLTAAERSSIVRLMMFGATITEWDAFSILEKLRTAPPAPAPKPAKARTTNARTEGMTANQRAIINLCSRPQGATGKELAEGCGWPSIAARTTCQKLADKFGFWLSETPKTKGRGIAFKMTPQEPTHPIV